jgi:type IV pilus assembly protein PilW
VLSRTINSRRNTSGFSIVDIMVGMVIGLIGIIVIMQVFSVFEAQKRSTTGSGDAQNGGAIALYSIQRDIQQAGYGISSLNMIGCDVQLPTGVTLPSLAPVTINHASIPAGDTNTDTLLVVYGSSDNPTEGNVVGTQVGSNYPVQAYTSFSAGPPADLVIAETLTRPSPCSGANKLILTPVTSSATTGVTVTSSITGMTGGALYNLGPTPIVRAYAVRNGNLTQCNYTVNDCSIAGNTANTAIWTPIANNIVSLRAQYGRDTIAGTMTGMVDTYDQTTPTTNCQWVRTSAIRIVLVARNDQPNNIPVTQNEPIWAGTTANSPTGFTSSALPIVLTTTTVPSNFTWQSYRYKIFETTSPIPNIQLLVSPSGGPSGC